MNYDFKCENCNKTVEVDINMNDYDKEKNNQFCPVCHSKMNRVLNWSGVAIGKGEGWFGKAGSNVI